MWLGEKLDKNRTRRLESLPGWSWDRKEIRSGSHLEWEEAFQKLLEFEEREGHVLVPQDHQTADGFRLGNWVKHQKQLKGIMPPHRKSKLEELSHWKWAVRTHRAILWNNAFRYLMEFVDAEGHARVFKDYKTKDGFRLGGWVQAQRSTTGRMRLEYQTQLEALPGWTWDALSDRWEEGFRHLLEFSKRERHAKVKQGSVAGDGYPLGAWVANQRARRSKIPAERKSRLESLSGWIWAVDSLQWDDWIDLLKEFARTNGHTRVPQAFKTSDGYLLGRWVNTRRTKRDGLTPGQQSQLESLPGWVWRVT